MSLTLKTTGGPLEISWYTTPTDTTTSVTVVFQIFVDGVAIAPDTGGGTFVTFSDTMSQTLIVPVAPGFHKVDLYWNNGGSGTLSLNGVRRAINAREL